MTEFFILLTLLFLSGLFSGSETALVNLSIARVQGLVAEGRHGAAALYRLKKDPSRMLTTILIGNNLVNIAASAIATVLATRLFGSAGPGIAVGVLTIVILVFGEITPKSLATRYSERISLFIAPPMLGFMRLILPLVWLFGQLTTYVHRVTGGQGDPMVTESEVIHMLGYGEIEGTIQPSERAIIERVFAFNDLNLRDVMTPRREIFSLDGSLTVAAALPTIAHGFFSRIPLFNDEPDNLHKVLFLRDALKAVADGRTEQRLDEIANEPVFVPQQQTIDELFTLLRTLNTHLAIVVDEYGTVRGVVTMEDLVEELLGEIYDESDVTPTVLEKLADDTISVDCATELRLVEKFFGFDLPGKPTDTVSLWILSHTEYIPQENETFTIDALEVTVIKASKRRIKRVNIRHAAADSE